MTYASAVRFLEQQDKSLRKVNGVKFIQDGYEYRLKYEGGFASFVAVERRRVGSRNFLYFTGYGAYHCRDSKEALRMARDEIKKAQETRTY